MMVRVFVLAAAGLMGIFVSAQHPQADRRSPPKVVLVGDSIRLSYAPLVAENLNGTATIVSPAANGGDSSNVLKNLEKWVISEQPDVVHFNCGIHDTKFFAATQQHQVSPEKYAENLKRIVESIRSRTKAVVLFATSTPILDERAAAARKGRDYVLRNASIEQYNRIAGRVMNDLNVPINDLNVLIAKPKSVNMSPDELIVADGVHLSDAGKEVLAEAVSQAVSEHLPKPAPDR
ncbi:MAG: SGNH/GDSL hydrolase family protein [Planctomycetaceae bacterium]|nr:SGNH/GDSL hydrolase family protein [Planctomycetaceae bacterium]